MNENELLETLNQIRQQVKIKNPGKTDDEVDEMILDAFFESYCEDKMDVEDLCGLAQAMGYEVNEEIIEQMEKEKKGRK